MILTESDRTGAHDWEVKKYYASQYLKGRTDVVLAFHALGHMGYSVDVVMSRDETLKLIEELRKAVEL